MKASSLVKNYWTIFKVEHPVATMAHVCTAWACVTIFSTGSKFQPVYNTTLILKPPVLMCSCSRWFNISASHWLEVLDPAMLQEVSSTCCKARTLFVASLCPFLLQKSSPNEWLHLTRRNWYTYNTYDKSNQRVISTPWQVTQSTSFYKSAQDYIAVKPIIVSSIWHICVEFCATSLDCGTELTCVQVTVRICTSAFLCCAG